jgi:hypothetical protein
MQPPVVPPPVETPRRFGALRHRDFALLWSGLLVSNAGTWLPNVALAGDSLRVRSRKVASAAEGTDQPRSIAG